MSNHSAIQSQLATDEAYWNIGFADALNGDCRESVGQGFSKRGRAKALEGFDGYHSAVARAAADLA